MSLSETGTVVIDIGSSSIKAGMSPEKEPLLLLTRDAICGNQFGKGKSINWGEFKDSRYPIERGIIVDFDVLESAFQCILHEHLKQSSPSLFCTEIPENKKTDRECLTELAFEKFNCSAFYLSTTNVISLYSYGAVHGVVLECGAGNTHVSAHIDGYTLPGSGISQAWAGDDLTAILNNQLAAYYQPFNKLNTFKEKECIVSQNFKHDRKLLQKQKKAYTLPDGREIYLGSEIIETAESLFDPPKPHLPLHKLILKSIKRSNQNSMDQKSLYSNIILTGGTSNLNGLASRVSEEMKLHSKKSPSIVHDKDISSTAAWRGGAILSDLTTFQCMRIHKREYEEIGRSIVHSKCFSSQAKD